jgi:nucleoside-diphosphate-sugar epimerase
MLAKALSEITIPSNCILFASGVSNSLENSMSEFLREENLLKKTIEEHPTKKIIYFSTCSIYDEEVKDRSYVIHKLAMENLIISKSNAYLILRVSNVVGYGGNKNTVINYFYNGIKQNIAFTLWEHAERNIIDVSDLVFVTKTLLENKIENKIINVANPNSIRVSEIVQSIEKFIGTKGKYTSLEKGKAVNIDISYIVQCMPEYFSNFDNSINYINKILAKYFL